MAGLTPSQQKELRRQKPQFEPGMGDDKIWGVKSSSNTGGNMTNPFGGAPRPGAPNPLGGPPRPPGAPGGPPNPLAGPPRPGGMGGPPNPLGGGPGAGGPPNPLGGGPGMGGPSNPWGGPPRPGGMGGPPNPMGGGMGSPGGFRPGMGGPMGRPSMGGPGMGGPGMGGPGAMGQPGMAVPSKDYADKALDAALVGGKHAGKATWGFSKAATIAISDTDSFVMEVAGVKGLQMSGVAALAGTVMWVLSIFLPMFGYGFYVFMGGALSAVVQLITFAAAKSSSDAKRARGIGPKEPKKKNQPSSTPPVGGGEGSPSPFPAEPPKPVTPPTPPPAPPAPAPADDDEEDEDDFDFDDFDDFDEFEDEDEDDEVDYDSLMDEDLGIKEGLYTRSFLFDKFNEGLIKINPKFNEFEEFDEDSDEFAEFESMIVEAAEIHGTKDENLPELVSAQENDFIVQMVITRTPRLPVGKIAEEVANTYMRDDAGNIVLPGCFAVSSEFGSKANITLYKSEGNVMVSLKDTYKIPKVKEFMTDTDHMMPVVIGNSAEGEVHTVDLKNATSLVLSGPPRKGKSWVAKLILNQMAMFMSPKDLHIYIGDPKDEVSDFNDWDVPHVRRKEFTPVGVINMLRWLTGPERERRMRILHEHKSKEIFEFRKRNPDIDMPFIFIVLDEMVSLVNAMDKEQKKEYDGLLNVLVSQLPGLGIRGMFIAHRVKNDIIPKNVSELIPYRITAGASGEEIKSNLGITNLNEFPYVLATQGDMGIKISDLKHGAPTFCHAAVIAKDNTTMHEFELFVQHVWEQIEPDIRSEKPIPGQEHLIDTGSTGSSKRAPREIEGMATIDPKKEKRANRVPSLSEIKSTVAPPSVTESPDPKVTIDDDDSDDMFDIDYDDL